MRAVLGQIQFPALRYLPGTTELVVQSPLPFRQTKSSPRMVPVLVANLSMGRPMRCSMLR